VRCRWTWLPWTYAPWPPRIFERFYRTDESRSRTSGAGAGLGLAIVQSLATAHGGRIELQSEPGAGAAFRLLLPHLADHEPDTPE